MGDEVRALEEQKNVADAVTLQGTVQRDPVGILEEAHKHARKTKNNKFNICLEKKIVCFFFFYSWSTPVEFGEDTSTQGVYCLQHMRGELRELWSLMESTEWYQKMLEFVGR